MKQVSGSRPVRFLAGVALALLVQGLLVAPSAEASCGHYVVVGAQPDGPVQATPQEHSPAVPAVPCSGPNCSGHTPIPLTVPAPPVNSPEESPAGLTSSPHLPDATARRSRMPEPSLRLIRTVSVIYHPPR